MDTLTIVKIDSELIEKKKEQIDTKWKIEFLILQAIRKKPTQTKSLKVKKWKQKEKKEAKCIPKQKNRNSTA